MIDYGELSRAGAALDDRFGVEVAARFGAGLPDRLAVLVGEWGIEVDGLVDSGANAVVLGARLATGERAVLKLSPDADALSRQVWMLLHLEPTGRVPAVHGSAPGAVLLERVLPGEGAGAEGRLPPSYEAWATLLRDLHSTGTEPVVDRLDERCEDMFERIGARQAAEAVRARVPDATWDRAVEVCRGVLREKGDQAAIHGDLHLGNVLASDEHGLVAVDPKLCVGDRCFDMVDFVAGAGDAEQMEACARRLAVLTEVDAERLLVWSAVNAVVTAISRITWWGVDQRSQELLAFSDHHLG